MPELLFSTADRDESHAKLEELLGSYPVAECRVDSNADEPYQVWSGPDVKPDAPPAQAPEPETVTLMLDEQTLETLARKVVEIQREEGG